MASPLPELVAVPEGQALPVPEGVSVQDAAGILEVFATAWTQGKGLRVIGSTLRNRSIE